MSSSFTLQWILEIFLTDGKEAWGSTHEWYAILNRTWDEEGYFNEIRSPIRKIDINLIHNIGWWPLQYNTRKIYWRQDEQGWGNDELLVIWRVWMGGRTGGKREKVKFKTYWDQQMVINCWETWFPASWSDSWKNQKENIEQVK